MAWVAVGLVDCPGPEVITLDDDEDEDTAQGPGMTPEERPFEWNCALCVKTRPKKYPRLRFSSMESFKCHLRRFCHICSSEFTSKEVCQKHFYGEHCEGKDDDGIEEMRFKFFGLDPVSKDKVEPCYFFCNSCNKLAKTFVDFMGHTKSCLGKFSCYEDETGLDLLQCFACSEVIGKSVTDLYLHFKDCTKAVVRDSYRVSIQVRQVRKFIFDELNLVISATGPQKNCGIISPVLLPTANGLSSNHHRDGKSQTKKTVVHHPEKKSLSNRLIFPTFLNLKDNKLRFLDNNIDYLKKVLTRESKVVLQRRINHRKKTVKIIEISLPDEDPTESWPLPAGVSISTLDLSVDPDPCVSLIDVQPRPDFNSQCNLRLLGSTTSGWVVAYTSERSDEIINVDGSFDPTCDNDNNLNSDPKIFFKIRNRGRTLVDDRFPFASSDHISHQFDNVLNLDGVSELPNKRGFADANSHDKNDDLNVEPENFISRPAKRNFSRVLKQNFCNIMDVDGVQSDENICLNASHAKRQRTNFSEAKSSTQPEEGDAENFNFHGFSDKFQENQDRDSNNETSKKFNFQEPQKLISIKSLILNEKVCSDPTEPFQTIGVSNHHWMIVSNTDKKFVGFNKTSARKPSSHNVADIKTPETRSRSRARKFQPMALPPILTQGASSRVTCKSDATDRHDVTQVVTGKRKTDVDEKWVETSNEENTKIRVKPEDGFGSDKVHFVKLEFGIGQTKRFNSGKRQTDSFRKPVVGFSDSGWAVLCENQPFVSGINLDGAFEFCPETTWENDNPQPASNLNPGATYTLYKDKEENSEDCYMEYEEPSFLPILNLDGAFELSDNEEENNAEEPRENRENRSEQNDESGAQEIYFKDELEDQEEDEDDEVQPIDHLEIGMPATYSSISSNASGIGRIMKTNAPQTPQRCSDCADEDRWFNTRDALLAHDVFFHGKDYCAPCDLFFPITSELDQHKGVLHNQFTCDQCGDCIDGKEKYTRHYLESHKILHCLLCSYSFTSENIEVHMVQGHRIPEWDMFSCGRMLDDKFTIIFDETKLTAKCNLCYRKFTREKIYNHLRYFHHSSTHQVVGLLQAAKFNLDPERSTQLQDVVTQEPKTSEIRPNPIFIEFEGRNGFCLIPQAQYICPMDSCATKNEVKLDAGLHMLLDHQMCFCHICGGFFVERRHLIRHHELLHLSDEKNTCTACHTQETFPDNFAFTIHMQDFHGTYLCCFCENLPFDSSLDLLSHMKQYHDMWQDREDAQETFYEQVLTSTLITINQNGGRIDCQMCSINFDTADLKNSENFRRHLSKFHSIRHLEKFMAMFDNQSGTFSVENLDLQNKHVPLNRNFNVEAKMSTSNATNFVERNLDEDSETEEEEEPLMKKRKRGPRKIVSKDEDHEKDDQIGEPVDPEGTSDTNPSEIKDEAEDDSDTEFPQSKEGESYQCEFCTTTTLSKASMRRHCLNSHALSPGYFRKDICHACNHCDAMFWSVADKVQHIAQSHSAIQGSLEKCFVCFHISPNKHALRRHFKRMHPEEKLFENVSYKCPYCGALFDLQRKMYDHIRDEHPDRSNHPCRQCDKKFTKFSSWKKHQEFHKQESIQHTCNSCGLTFETRKKYSWHVKNCDQTKKEPKLNFKCKLCEEKFADRDEREIHYKQVHPNVPMYPCNECGAKFNTKSARWSHGFSHKADDTFKCEHCGKTFNRRDTFREHLLIHTGPRYRCTHCPKEFVQRSNLRRHIRIHLGIKPYNCKFCPLTFSDKGACNSHMKIHTGDNKAKCTFCGQEFSKGQKLRYHMRLHTGEGLLTCDLCQKVFTNSYSLKTHLKRVHARIQERFPCYFCDRPGYVGNSRKSLKSHLEKVHPEAPKRCHMCMQEFSSSIEVNVHMMNVHFPEENGTKKSDDGGYQCRHCDANFPGLSDIKRHLTENHDVKSGMSMHYLNRYMNEVNFPTMTAEAPQFSVVLVAAEPELSSKAKKKEAARLKKLERQEQKEEQQLLKLQQRLEREQLRQDRELEKEQQRALKNQLKLRTKVRKPANPRKIVPNPIEDLDPMIDPETGVKLEPEDEDDDDLPYPGDFLQRVKSCIKEDEQNDYPEPDNNPLEPIIDVKIKDEPDQDYS